MRGEEDSFKHIAEFEASELTLFDLIGTVEEATNNFLLESSKYRKLPTQNSLNRLVYAAAYKEVCLFNIISYIYSSDPEEYSIEERAKIIHSLLIDDDKTRVSRLGELTNSEAYTPAEIGEDEFTQVIVELDENEIAEEEILSAIMTIYQKNSECDITNFVNEVSKTKNANALRLGKQIGRITLDLGKYSAAAAFGAWFVTRKLK